MVKQYTMKANAFRAAARKYLGDACNMCGKRDQPRRLKVPAPSGSRHKRKIICVSRLQLHHTLCIRGSAAKRSLDELASNRMEGISLTTYVLFAELGKDLILLCVP